MPQMESQKEFGKQLMKLRDRSVRKATKNGKNDRTPFPNLHLLHPVTWLSGCLWMLSRGLRARRTLRNRMCWAWGAALTLPIRWPGIRPILTRGPESRKKPISLERLKTSSFFGDLKITSTSTERQKHSQNLAPVLVIHFGNSLVFSRKTITSIGFLPVLRPRRLSTSSGKRSVSYFAWNFQSRLKTSISLEFVRCWPWEFPTNIGVGWVARLNFQSRLKISSVQSRLKIFKAGSLQCGFWPRNSQIPIWILPWIFWWIFSSYFFQGRWPEKSTKKSPAKFARDFVRENSPRISAEAFSWKISISCPNPEIFQDLGLGPLGE